MSKLLKAVEKAKRNRMLQEEQTSAESRSSAVKNTAAETPPPVPEAEKESESKPEERMGQSCSIPKSFYNDDIVLDEMELAKNRILTKHSSSSFTDIYNLLRTQIFHRTKRKSTTC